MSTGNSLFVRQWRPVVLSSVTVLIVVIGGYALLRTAPPTHDKTNKMASALPAGVWPTRVKSFADRLVEARCGGDGTIHLYFMDARTKTFASVAAARIEGEVSADNGDSTAFFLTPDRAGTTSAVSGSVFVGRAPVERLPLGRLGLYGIRVTVPYQGTDHSIRWRPEETRAWVSPQHAGGTTEAAMPDAPDGDEERKLFLTPAGKYTAADIAANGHAIASVRYRGALPVHNRKPPGGSPICPITETLANPRFTWIVDGQSYRFCCPPCIAEFVRQAREQPKTIRPPAAYVAR
ncbi:MAG: hypothetical protein SFU56_22045 [Capsulimonadales bacterium]|nr:hypothetical protein [Capsulimonadales bacterium]